MRCDMETSRYQRTSGGVKQIRTRKVKQRNASKNGTEFCLREQGIWDEWGKVLVLVQRGEEFIDREIQL